MEKEYKGLGALVIIDDYNLKIKAFLKKKAYPLNQMTYVFYDEPRCRLYEGRLVQEIFGKLTFSTKDNEDGIAFSEGERDSFKELHDFILQAVKDNLSELEYSDFQEKVVQEKSEVDKEKAKINNIFIPTKVIKSALDTFLEIDETKKLWRVDRAEYSFSDIVDFELLENGESVAKGGLGRAVVGGVLFGGAGAVVGGVTANRKNKAVCNSMRIKIVLNDINSPNAYIDLIKTATKKDSSKYKQRTEAAQECLSVLQLMCNIQNNVDEENLQDKENSDVDNLRKFKALLDDGIITQEDFDAKKKHILGI